MKSSRPIKFNQRPSTIIIRQGISLSMFIIFPINIHCTCSYFTLKI
uniref:Uncharacterized protein n=1 Tax=Amphimedon queenslandica TaxID=400682 RepID=A0A1X7TXZ6_AMPQE